MTKEKVEIETKNTPLPNVVPEKHVISNAKFANEVMKIAKEELRKPLEATIFTERKKGKEKEVKISYILAFLPEDKNLEITGEEPLTEFDRSVMDAVTSLYIYGDNKKEKQVITPAMVYRTMIHATESETPSPKQIKAIVDSIDKMRFFRVRADCSEELVARKATLDGCEITGGEIDSYLLALGRKIVRIKVDKDNHRQISKKILSEGEIDEETEEIKVTAYEILSPPILYEYSSMTDQVLTVPAELLSICDSNGKRIRSTERRIAIKSYMLRRIEIMKGKTGRHQSRNILYDTVFKECIKCEWDNNPSKEGEAPDGWEGLSEKEQRHIREYIMQVLDYWKKCKYIDGCKELYHGKKKRGVEIVLNRKIA